MRIVQISQQMQFLRLEQKPDLTLRLEPGFHGNGSAIPKTTKFVGDHEKDVLKRLTRYMEKGGGYECIQDLLLSVAFPMLQPSIQSFYRNREKHLVDIVSADMIAKIDDMLLVWLQKALEIYKTKNR